jgi:hypothetical protein
MRSHLVFEAVSHVPNRYQLCQLASKAIRMMHRPNARVPETANRVLSSFDTFSACPDSVVQASEPNPGERCRAA